MAGQFEYIDFSNLEGLDSNNGSEVLPNTPPCAPRLGNSDIQGLPVQNINPLLITPTKKQRRKTAHAATTYTFIQPERKEDPVVSAFGAFITTCDGQVDDLINNGKLPNDSDPSGKEDSSSYYSPTEDSSSSDSSDMSDDEDFDPDSADLSEDSVLNGGSEDEPCEIHYSAYQKSCHYCPMKFETLRKAQRHMRISHKQYQKGICGICKKKFPNKRTFCVHLQTHDVEKLHVCHICGAAFARKPVFIEHMDGHAITTKTFACLKCSKLFKTKVILQRHERIHNVYTCDFCSKTLKGRMSLLYHIRAHMNSAAFECVFCGAKFTHMASRDTHMRNYHNIICLVCGGKYFTTADVEKHLKKDHSKKEIKACVGNDLAYEKVTKFQCEVCSSYFASKQALDFHTTTHTGIGKRRPKKKKKLDKAEK